MSPAAPEPTNNATSSSGEGVARTGGGGRSTPAGRVGDVRGDSRLFVGGIGASRGGAGARTSPAEPGSVKETDLRRDVDGHDGSHRIAAASHRSLSSAGMHADRDNGASNDACALCGRAAGQELFRKSDWAYVRCRECGLVSLRPMPTPEQLLAHYEESYRAGRYSDFASAVPVRT